MVRFCHFSNVVVTIMLTKLYCRSFTRNCLKSLYLLFFHYNSFTGHIPPSFGELESLYYLQMNNNKLSGTLPHELSKLTQLMNLEVQSNGLTGTLPHHLIDNMPMLQNLVLLDNKLHGKIDLTLTDPSQLRLEYIDFGSNQFTGTIPANLFEISSLQSISFVSNCMHGTIPTAAICGAERLKQLYLGGVGTADKCQTEFYLNIAMHIMLNSICQAQFQNVYFK